MTAEKDGEGRIVRAGQQKASFQRVLGTCLIEHANLFDTLTQIKCMPISLSLLFILFVCVWDMLDNKGLRNARLPVHGAR